MNDGRPELVEVHVFAGVPAVFAVHRSLLVGGGEPRYLVARDRAGAVATLTDADIRGVPSVAVTLGEAEARGLRDALTEALGG